MEPLIEDRTWSDGQRQFRWRCRCCGRIGKWMWRTPPQVRVDAMRHLRRQCRKVA